MRPRLVITRNRWPKIRPRPIRYSSTGERSRARRQPVGGLSSGNSALRSDGYRTVRVHPGSGGGYCDRPPYIRAASSGARVPGGGIRDVHGSSVSPRTDLEAPHALTGPRCASSRTAGGDRKWTALFDETRTVGNRWLRRLPVGAAGSGREIRHSAASADADTTFCRAGKQSQSGRGEFPSDQARPERAADVWSSPVNTIKLIIVITAASSGGRARTRRDLPLRPLPRAARDDDRYLVGRGGRNLLSPDPESCWAAPLTPREGRSSTI